MWYIWVYSIMRNVLHEHVHFSTFVSFTQSICATRTWTSGYLLLIPAIFWIVKFRKQALVSHGSPKSNWRLKHDTGCMDGREPQQVNLLRQWAEPSDCLYCNRQPTDVPCTTGRNETSPKHSSIYKTLGDGFLFCIWVDLSPAHPFFFLRDLSSFNTSAPHSLIYPLCVFCWSAYLSHYALPSQRYLAVGGHFRYVLHGRFRWAAVFKENHSLMLALTGCTIKLLLRLARSETCCATSIDWRLLLD